MKTGSTGWFFSIGMSLLAFLSSAVSVADVDRAALEAMSEQGNALLVYTVDGK